jgi:LmbE family N-acetylglucosaminyl deacetylase
MEEKDLIPFQTSRLPDGPWLVFSPHPDDESFGMGGSLLLAREAGIDVDIVFMTDGSEGEETHAADVARTREREALNACEFLKVRQCYFWREKDRELRFSETLSRKVVQTVASLASRSIFVPSCLELHPDHRATSTIVWDGLQKIPALSATVFTYDIGTQGPANTIVDITTVMDGKRVLMELYASQVSVNRYIELVQSLDRARTFTLPGACKAAEGFYAIPILPGMTLEQPMGQWFRRFFRSPDPRRTPLVSVIVRTRDRVRTLNTALASIAVQDHPNIELVVVNDGGEDVTSTVNAFEHSFRSVRYLRLETTQGRSAAGNRGMECATGEYFMFLDDDDWIAPAHISNLVRAHRSGEDHLLVYTGIQVVNCGPGGPSPSRILNDPFDRNRLYYENYIPIHAALIRRSVIDAGFRFDESLEMLEDWDFWLQLCQITVSFAHVDAVTGYYRSGEGHGLGYERGNAHARRQIYARWSKTWGIDEIDDLLTRLAIFSKKAD